MLIGSDVRSIASESLAILKNTELIAVNQDPLGTQAALVKATSPSTDSAWKNTNVFDRTPPSASTTYTWKSGIKGVTTCDYGNIPAAQKWSFTSSGQIQQGADVCLLATTPPGLGSCSSPLSHWDLKRANETVRLPLPPKRNYFVFGSQTRHTNLYFIELYYIIMFL